MFFYMNELSAGYQQQAFQTSPMGFGQYWSGCLGVLVNSGGAQSTEAFSGAAYTGPFHWLLCNTNCTDPAHCMGLCQ